MAVQRGLKPFVLEHEGLFARKSSSNILSDPRILEHLRIVAQEAQVDEEDEENLSNDDEIEYQKRDLSEKIAAYNKRNQLGAFQVSQEELDYEGAVRFYFEAGRQELTKAVKISNKTKVEDLLPILVEKFNLQKVGCRYTLFVVHEIDEIALDDSDCPLTIAINALKVPRFVLRLKSKDPINVDNAVLTKQNSSTSSVSRNSSENAGYDPVDSSVTPRSILRNTTPNDSIISKTSSDKNVSISSKISDTDPTPVANSSHKATSKAKRTKSFSQIAAMVRKKKGSEKKESPELSTYKLAPGILKVFGDHVSPGSNYKSVRASTISTASEVVKQALEKYSIENANPNDYVLCDVVGHFKVEENKSEKDFEEAQWVTEYMRVVNDREKPLVVQSLWKPASGRLRRFELIKRIQIDAGCFFINTAENLSSNSALSSPTMDQTDSERSSIKSDSVVGETSFGDSYALEVPNGAARKNSPSQGPLTVPDTTPFLLLVKGYDSLLDQIFCRLDKPNLTIGSPRNDRLGNRPDICLHAPDILPVHCVIHKKISLDKGSHETNIDDINFEVIIEPSTGSSVYVNGVKVEQPTMLKPGQLLLFGIDYCFVFKDPTQVQEKKLKLSWLDSLKQMNSKADKTSKQSGSRNSSAQTESLEDGLAISSDEGGETHDGTIKKSEAEVASEAMEVNAFERSSVTLTYRYEEEDSLLERIIHGHDQNNSTFKLTPAYLLTMMIEHSCATFTEVRARKLFLKISSALQGVAWEKTKEIGKNGTESNRKDDTMDFFNAMLLDLAPVVSWMANALEMLHYLQCNLNRYLQHNSGTAAGIRDSLASADEELLTVLEEVIMFTFQQTVYHLTKVLYSALPAILDTNPFQNEDGDDDEEAVSTPPAVAQIIGIFENTLSLVSTHNVHPHIITQLFAYLFFFTNASLFNSLMERGAGGKFYRWTKGVQIRGNLDVLEEWAIRSGLQEHFADHLRKIVAAVALLSIPKAQLMLMDWNTIREDYGDLNASQVQQLLGEYQLGGKGRPRGWYPPPEEVEAALRTSDVLESFATHPPLLLPTTNFVMDLNKFPDDLEFSNSVEDIIKTHGIENGVPQNSNPLDKTQVSRTASNTSAVIQSREHSDKLIISIEPSMTSTPQRNEPANGNSNAKMNTKTKDERSSSHSSTEQAVNIMSNENSGDSASNTPIGTPELAVRGDLQHRHPTPLPNKKVHTLIEKPIDYGDTSEMSTDDEKRSLGDVQSIQIAARKGISSNVSQKTEISGRVSKSNIVYAGSKEQHARTNGGVPADLDNNNLISSLVKAGNVMDEKEVVGDVDFTSNVEFEDEPDEVFIVELTRGEKGLGLGLIDGLITPLESPGIYIRTIVSKSPASKDGRIQLGDRILAVNGTSLVGSDYSKAMDMIIHAGSTLSFLIAKSDAKTVEKILSSQC